MGKVWLGDKRSEGAFNGMVMPTTANGPDLALANCLAAAAHGDSDAYYELGVTYSTGSQGIGCDLIEAHKWFNLAAVAGHSEAALCRADISNDLTMRQISEAQRRAREWLAATTPSRRAA